MFPRIEDDYEQLPYNSGADAFFEMEYRFSPKKEINLEFLEEKLPVIEEVTRSFIKFMKDEWLLSHPDFYIKGTGDSCGVKIAMRKKKDYIK